ncbi:MAG: mechanosensitive ion channel, partial [Clostridia bacterium]|nr:mechanosensitive ion channel [Deltaproteobacteria bacterium]
ELIVDSLESTGTVTIFMKTLLDSFIVATRISCLMFGLARAFLAPRKEATDTKEGWRIVQWSDEQVATLRWLPLGVGLVSGLRLMIERANDTLGTSLAVSVFQRTVLATVSAVMVAHVLLRIGRVRLEIRNAHLASADAKPSTVPRRGAVPVVLLVGLAWLDLSAAALAVLLGFNAFGIFLVRQLIQIAVVTTVLQLATMLTDDLFDALLSEHFLVGRFLRRAVGVSSQYISQTAVVLAGVARVILFYVAVRIVLLRVGGEDVSSAAGRIQEGIADLRIGEVTISPSSIIGAMTVFAVVWFATKALRGWLEGSYLPHTTLDSGARNSLNTGVGYIGFIAAVLLAIAYLGVSFDKVALIASALSVGIGFGLQQIISNFVSGLILLVERPIKVGDLVSISGSTGDVRKISVRATELLLGDGSTFVVPNAELISKPIVNKTRIGVLGQVQFILRISYSVDPNKARDLVLDAMKANDKILKAPPPAVFIDDVDDRGYVFNIVGNTSSPRDTYGAKSDLFFEITRRLRDAEIPIGSPIASVKISDNREVDVDAEGPDDVPSEANDVATHNAIASNRSNSADNRPAMGDGKGAVRGGAT